MAGNEVAGVFFIPCENKDEEKSGHKQVHSLGGPENLEIFIFFVISHQNRLME